MHRLRLLAIAVAALLALPALAAAKPHPDNPGHAPDTPPGQVVREDTPGADAGQATDDPADPSDDAADPSDDATDPPDDATGDPVDAPEPDYGALCADQSRKHVAGQAGTPFSACVTGLTRLAAGDADTPAAACRALSRRHVAGQRGTPYSRCVAAAAKLQDELDAGTTDPGDGA